MKPASNAIEIPIEWAGVAKSSADLFAAAPDLYEALKKSVEQMLIGLTAIQKLLEKCGDADVLHDSEKGLMAQIASAQNILAKARGESEK